MESNEEKKKNIRNRQLKYLSDGNLEYSPIKQVTVNNSKGIEGKQTFENSIYSNLGLSDHGIDEKDEMFLCCFLGDSINIYRFIKSSFDIQITNSINPVMLVKIELNKLNKFFETGAYQEGKAEHSRLATGDVYDLYTSLLYGCSINIVEHDDWDLVEELFDGLFEDKKAYLTGHINAIALGWWLSIDLQVLLWLRDYLEELDKLQDFKEIFSRRERVSPLEFLPSESRKQGFQVDKPLQTIPALYQALTDNNLIDKISFSDFQDAFINEKGCIDWHGNKDQLGYLIKTLKSKGIITSKNHMETATRVFKATSGKALDAGGLSTSADNLSEKNRLSMDTLISQVIDS